MAISELRRRHRVPNADAGDADEPNGDETFDADPDEEFEADEKFGADKDLAREVPEAEPA